MESCAVTKDAGEDWQEEGDADAMSRSEWKTFRRVEAGVGWVDVWSRGKREGDVSLYAGWELENREKRALRGAIKGNLEKAGGVVPELQATLKTLSLSHWA